MTRRKPVTPSPADVFLHALRRWKPEAYTCAPEVGRWRADCPNCGGHRTVRISEHGAGGPIAVWCTQGRCGQDEIIAALKAALTTHDCEEARFWRAAALDGLALARKLQTLADDLLEALIAQEMRPRLEEAA